MRMWLVDPKIMCRQHLLGEHNELHSFIGVLRKKQKIDGYIKGNMLEISSIIKRHEELVEEMTQRGYNHQSPLSDDGIDLTYLPESYLTHKINKEDSFNELIRRCPHCRKRIEDLSNISKLGE